MTQDHNGFPMEMWQEFVLSQWRRGFTVKPRGDDLLATRFASASQINMDLLLAMFIGMHDASSGICLRHASRS